MRVMVRRPVHQVGSRGGGGSAGINDLITKPLQLHIQADRLPAGKGTCDTGIDEQGLGAVGSSTGARVMLG